MSLAWLLHWLAPSPRSPLRSPAGATCTEAWTHRERQLSPTRGVDTWPGTRQTAAHGYSVRLAASVKVGMDHALGRPALARIPGEARSRGGVSWAEEGGRGERARGVSTPTNSCPQACMRGSLAPACLSALLLAVPQQLLRAAPQSRLGRPDGCQGPRSAFLAMPPSRSLRTTVASCGGSWQPWGCCCHNPHPS